MFGRQLIKHWSSTQTIISLSSGEAEYYRCVRGASHGLGFQSLLKDFGHNLRLKLKTDAAVARSIASRRGLGGVKHIEVSQLWLQEKINLGVVEIEKVKGAINISDTLTKFKDAQALVWHLDTTSQVVKLGRHEIMPTLRKDHDSAKYDYLDPDEEQPQRDAHRV